MFIVLFYVPKEGGDVGVWPWGWTSPMVGDNIRWTLNDETIRNVKSLEGTKKGDSGDALLSRVACSPAIKAWKLLGVCCCQAKLLTNE